MAQAINVAATKKQILRKKTALENGVKKAAEMRKKLDADREKINADYEKAWKAWEQSVFAIVQSMTLTKDNTSVDHYGYQGSITKAYISIPTKKLPKRPERKDIKWSDYEVEVPTYYDAYHREIDSRAVLAHFEKSLDMLEVLPAGTVEVTVKDFNFLTRF